MAFNPAVSSKETTLFQVIEFVIQDHFPESRIMPNGGRVFTDSHFFRGIAIECYSFNPVIIPIGARRGVYSNNECISIENIRRSVRLTLKIVEQVVY